jgi:hypothetical protein
MTSEIRVRGIRRHGDHQIRYLLDRGEETRKLTLFLEFTLSTAIVTNGKDVPLALLLARPPTPEVRERRLLLRFGVKEEDDLDDFTKRVLQPAFIRSLPLPAAQTEPHFKDSDDFALNRKGPHKVDDVNTIPLPAHAIAKGKIKDVFCKPSLSVQMNSALNACFKSICGYIECKEKDPLARCFDEAQEVGAFCAALG